MTKFKYFHYVLFCVFTLIFLMVPRNRQQRMNKMHTLYFTDTYLNYKNNSNIHHCITGNVIGTRPRVHLVYFTELKYHKESEDTHNSTSISRLIFDEKFGQGNKEELRRAVHLQAIGNYVLHATILVLCSVFNRIRPENGSKSEDISSMKKHKRWGGSDVLLEIQRR